MNAAGKALLTGVPAEERKLLEEQLDRVELYLRDRVRTQRGMLVFAGAELWQPVPLQVEVQNELHWGRPALSQLLGLLSRYKPYGVAVVGLSGTRFFRYHLGELSEIEGKKFEIDISHWRKKEMGEISPKKITK